MSAEDVPGPALATDIAAPAHITRRSGAAGG